MPDVVGVMTDLSDTADHAYGICQIGDTRVAVPLEALSEVCQTTSLSTILIKSPVMCGGIDMRGQLIPVINLPLICGLKVPTHAPAFAVILQQADQHLAFLVDQVLGIIQVTAEKVQKLIHCAVSGEQGCVRQVFIEAGQVTSILDVDRLFGIPDVYSVQVQPKNQPRTVDDGRISMLTFMVGGAQFSVDSGDVYGTVPRQAIEVGVLTSGYCLGSIIYHHRRIPVLNTANLFGLGYREKWGASEVVVLRCPNDRLIGLAVDAIQDIRRIDLGRYAKVPGVIARKHNFLTQVIMREDGVQVFVLSAANLLHNAGVAAIAGLSSDPVKTDMTGDGAAQGHRGGERYLVVQAGRTFAVPLGQVTSIIPIPERIVPCSKSENGLQGFFSRPPNSVPLINLVALLREPAGASDTARVLLIGEGEHQIGFQVERVFSIETSNWTLDGLRKQGSESEALVQLGTGQARRATPVLDLDALARVHFHPHDDHVTQTRTDQETDALTLNRN